MRPIKFRAYGGRYEIGEDGSVWSLDFNHSGKRRQMKQYLDDDGYPYVILHINACRVKRVIHRLVAQLHVNAFPPAGTQVNHKNGVRSDNRAENLEWITHRENTIHGWRVNGRKASMSVITGARERFGGVRNPKAKVNPEIARSIRAMRQDGLELKVIGAAVGLSVAQVSAIARGKWWKENPELLK